MVEQAAVYSGAADEARIADRIAQQEEELAKLIALRDTDRGQARSERDGDGRSASGPSAWASTISMASWQPNLFRNTTQIFPFYDNPGWNLITAQADDAIEYLRRITAINPDQPFFIYYVPGAVHALHHPTPEWIKKISDMHLFDKGWNELRDIRS